MSVETFPDRLGLIVGDHGTMRRLSIESGVPYRTIQNYLGGGRRKPTMPTLGNLVAIADTAGVSIEWLATGRGPMFRQTPVNQSLRLAPEIREVIAGGHLDQVLFLRFGLRPRGAF